jgi:hypothetical protein
VCVALLTDAGTGRNNVNCKGVLFLYDLYVFRRMRRVYWSPTRPDYSYQPSMSPYPESTWWMWATSSTCTLAKWPHNSSAKRWGSLFGWVCNFGLGRGRVMESFYNFWTLYKSPNECENGKICNNANKYHFLQWLRSIFTGSYHWK